MQSFREFLKVQNDVSSEIKEEIERLEHTENDVEAVDELDPVCTNEDFPIS